MMAHFISSHFHSLHHNKVILEAAAVNLLLFTLFHAHYFLLALVPTYFSAFCDMQSYDRYQSKVSCLNMTIWETCLIQVSKWVWDLLICHSLNSEHVWLVPFFLPL